MRSFSVAEVAARCGGRVAGDGELRLSGVRSLDAAGPSELAFAADTRSERAAVSSRAGALLVRSSAGFPARTVVEVADPTAAVARILTLFHPPRSARPGVHPTAIVDGEAHVDPAAEIGPYAVVGALSRVEAGAILEAHTVVGRSCVIGPGAWLHPNVVLYDGVRLGARVEVHSGAVLGADGFGYATTPQGLVKIPQVGGVVLGDDVEIGANTCIDRATFEDTTVGAGTKIDDLVMIGHNCVVGRHCFLCGQAGLAGSTTVGNGVILGGQVGVGGHLTIGNGVKAGAQTGIGGDVPDGQAVFGSPHMKYSDAMRVIAEMRRLPETARLVRVLGAPRSGGEESRG